MIPYPRGIREIASRFGCELPTHYNPSRFGSFDITAQAKGTTSGAFVRDPNASSSVSSRLLGGKKSAPAPIRAAPPPAPAPPVKGYTAPLLPTNYPPLAADFMADRKPAALPSPVAVRAPLPMIATPAAAFLRLNGGRMDLSKSVFAPPVVIDPKTALAVADKLLADPSIKNSKAIVNNTMSVAQIDPAAFPRESRMTIDPEQLDAIRRGAAVIHAAGQIREQTGAAPGEPAIPISSPAESAAVNDAVWTTSYSLSDGDLDALAAVAPPEQKGLWRRFFDWIASWSD